jgi:hypothetical protein
MKNRPSDDPYNFLILLVAGSFVLGLPFYAKDIVYSGRPNFEKVAIVLIMIVLWVYALSFAKPLWKRFAEERKQGYQDLDDDQ